MLVIKHFYLFLRKAKDFLKNVVRVGILNQISWCKSVGKDEKLILLAMEQCFCNPNWNFATKVRNIMANLRNTGKLSLNWYIAINISQIIQLWKCSTNLYPPCMCIHKCNLVSVILLRCLANSLPNKCETLTHF